MSLSQYVIICKGRVDYKTAVRETVEETRALRIRALSDCAALLLHHIEITQPGRLTEADVKPISDLQHLLMDQAETLSGIELQKAAAQMFGLLDALEEKFDKPQGPPKHLGYNGPLG